MIALSKLARGVHIGPAGRAALRLLWCCPRMPTGAVAVLLGHRQAATTAQLLARLRRAGMAQFETVRLGPVLGSRPLRLWSLTDTGRAFVAPVGATSAEEALDLTIYGQPERRRETARQRDMPLLLACYRLLAELARDSDPQLRVRVWEHPWIRTVPTTESFRGRHARLPAAAVLESPRDFEGDQSSTLLLLPDLGTAPLASYRSTLQALMRLPRSRGCQCRRRPDAGHWGRDVGGTGKHAGPRLARVAG